VDRRRRSPRPAPVLSAPQLALDLGAVGRVDLCFNLVDHQL
jgi:hypothetical protein